MKRLEMVGTGWARAIAELLHQSSAPRSTKPLSGSNQRYVHHSAGGATYKLNNKRSRDRAARRRGEMSARQQKLGRKHWNRMLRDLDSSFESVAA